MRLGIMQPYFFPYLGYFALIAATDHFVVFDSVQYIRRGWVNRNRVLKPRFGEAQFIRVPVAAHRRETLIKDIRIARDLDWKYRIARQLNHYAGRAPFFSQAMRVLDECLAIETDHLVDLNVHCLTVVCKYLQIPFDYSYFEDIAAEIPPVRHAGEWALHISTAKHAAIYINPIGGRDIFDSEQFEGRGIELQFLEHALPNYRQGSSSFVPGLSILDVLMFNSLEESREMVAQYTTTAASACLVGDHAAR